MASEQGMHKKNIFQYLFKQLRHLTVRSHCSDTLQRSCTHALAFSSVMPPALQTKETCLRHTMTWCLEAFPSKSSHGLGYVAGV